VAWTGRSARVPGRREANGGGCCSSQKGFADLLSKILKAEKTREKRLLKKICLAFGNFTVLGR